jgi:hypothetical protein
MLSKIGEIDFPQNLCECRIMLQSVEYFFLAFKFLFCGAEYSAACCVGSTHRAKPDP